MDLRLGSDITLKVEGESYPAIVVAVDDVGFSVQMGKERFSFEWQDLASGRCKVMLEPDALKREAA